MSSKKSSIPIRIHSARYSCHRALPHTCLLSLEDETENVCSKLYVHSRQSTIFRHIVNTTIYRTHRNIQCAISKSISCTLSCSRVFVMSNTVAHTFGLRSCGHCWWGLAHGSACTVYWASKWCGFLQSFHFRELNICTNLKISMAI